MLSTSQTETITSSALRLAIIRGLWLIGVLLALAFVILGIPALYAAYQIPCGIDADVWCQMFEQGLTLAGMPRIIYATYMTALMVLLDLPFLILCLFIAIRRANHPKTLLFSLALLLLVVTNTDLAQADAIIALIPASVIPVHLIMTLGNLSVLLFMVFPDGHFVPSWTRWVAFLAALAIVLLYLPPQFGGDVVNAIPWLSDGLFFTVITLNPLAVVGSVIYRYKRVANAEQRQQIKWVALSLAFALLTTVPGSVFDSFFVQAVPVQEMPGAYLMYLAIVGPLIYHLNILLFALAFYISISRYRLWDVDFLVNRSVVYTALTIFLTGVFGGLAYISYQFIPQQYAGLGVGMAAVIAGLLFQPARNRLQQFVDKRLYNIYVDYHAAPRADRPSTLKNQAGLPAEHLSILKNTKFSAYTNRELVAQGGMGAIYKSTHPTLGKPVAIKIIRPDLVKDPAIVQRFEREGRLMSRLEHPNIPRVYDFGCENDQWYMILDWIPGQDLRKFLLARGRLSLTELQPILLSVAAALDFAHAQGIFHRDVKPANIIISPDGKVFLTDFGIARQFDSQTELTQGGLVGTLDYMAPEQIQSATHLDGRADIYALGVMTYQLLTGKLPFQREHPGMLVMAHLTEPAPDACALIPNLPRRTSLAIQQAMQKNPQERFLTAAAFMQTLFESA